MGSIKHNIQRAKQQPNIMLRCPLEQSSERALVDVVIASSVYLKTGFNLINDALVLPKSQLPYELQLYYLNDYKEQHEQELPVYQDLIALFAERIKELDKGWVNIIPYNRNLIFLQGENGKYDFIIKNQRDELFKHQIYEPYLKRSDIPLFDETYHFERWYYFEFEGFRELVEHRSEQEFYKNGGEAGNYYNVLYNYLYKEYSKTLKNRKTNKKLAGFSLVPLENGKQIMVSNLVSIADFDEFLADNKDYLRNRHKSLDRLDTMNADEDTSLPVALTYYDVLKYISWFNEKNDVQARLLSYKEYQEISPFEFTMDRENQDWWNEDDLLFFDDNNQLLTYSGYHEYTDEHIFQSWQVKFNQPKFKQKHGLDFMHNNRFAEWLLEKTCIRSFSLTSFYGDEYVLRAGQPLASTGKYKYTKIGFRLCYDLIDNRE